MPKVGCRENIANVNTNHIMVLHQNIQCLKNKTLELEVFLDGMEREPDFLCFSEHWMAPGEDEYVKINKYKLISSYSRKDMQHGGVCIFGRQELQLENDNLLIV